MPHPPSCFRGHVLAARLLLVVTFSLAGWLPGPGMRGAGAQEPTPAPPPPAPAAQPAAASPETVRATTAPPAQPHATPAPAAPGGADAKSPDGGWPRSITTPSGATLILYQPQISSWEGPRNLVAMAALSYTAQGATKPQIGTMKLSSPTSVSAQDRMVSLTKIQISEIKFSSLGKNQSQEVASELLKVLPTQPVVIGLDRVMATIDKSQIRANGVQVQTKAPPIFFSERPAILVQFDGAPVMSPITGTKLSFVLNTNWDLFHDPDMKLYFLRDSVFWYQSPEFKGEWRPLNKLPPDFSKLPADDNWNYVRSAMPPKKIDKNKVPTIFVSETPAELIVLKGEPDYEDVKGTDLKWVKNTESDLFRMKRGDFYYLVSGRWFRAPKLEGPWEFASSSLPPDFAKIPEDHPRSRVRSSVPGTNEAAEAVLLAQIPQTAQVSAKEVKPPEVSYVGGKPDFKAVEGSTVKYAANSDFDVLVVSGKYYLCYQAVWFVGGSPTGPWVVCTNVPKEIYAMPSSSPVYNVTYVTVVDDDPDYPVYGYTPGYMGITIAFGCAMWGAGYYHPPYWGYPPYGPPYYRPYPSPYGGGAVYNPWTGSYGRYNSAYGPYGGVAAASSYNARTGTYKRSAAAYGPYGSAHATQAYNPRTGAYASSKGGSSPYGSWNSTAVKRGDDWARTQRVTDANGNTRWAAQGSGGGAAKGWRGPGGSGFVGQSGSGDIYAGKDGNAYRKTDGGWQKYENGGWNDVSGGGNRPSNQPAQRPGDSPSQRPSAGTQPSQKPSAGTQPSQRPSAGTQPSQRPSQPQAGTMDQLNRDASSRSTGNQRSQQYNNYQRSSGGSRGGGGGFRGGGGRRR